MQLFLAVLPILLLTTLIIAFRKGIIFSAGVALGTLLLVALWWGVDGTAIAAASVRGTLLAVEIILIIGGALAIIEVLRRRNLFGPLQTILTRISNDYRVHVMIIALGLVTFIEGAAGFGTPAIVAVPLLIALGFKPLHAVILALIGNTIPVSFGAVGLPITYGVQSVIQPLTGSYDSITSSVVFHVAAFNILAYTVLALLLLAVSVMLRKQKMMAFLHYVPFAVLSGLAVSVPAFITAVTVGPELASIVGGLAGICIIGVLAHYNIAIPRTAQLPPAPSTVLAASYKDIWRALYPYLLLIAILVATRLPYLPVGSWLQQLRISFESLFGTAIGYTIAPLYSAAGILVFCAFVVVALSWRHIETPQRIAGEVLRLIRRPFIALLLVLIFVQIFIFSGTGDAQASSMPHIIAGKLSVWSGSLWPFLAPFLGALGSFTAGSATVSNLIFSGLQYDIAHSLEVPPVILLSLQALGASLGNMVALHNVVAALAIAGLSDTHGHQVIRTNIWPLLILLTVTGLAGLAAIAFGLITI